MIESNNIFGDLNLAGFCKMDYKLDIAYDTDTGIYTFVLYFGDDGLEDKNIHIKMGSSNLDLSGHYLLFQTNGDRLFVSSVETINGGQRLEEGSVYGDLSKTYPMLNPVLIMSYYDLIYNLLNDAHIQSKGEGYNSALGFLMNNFSGKVFKGEGKDIKEGNKEIMESSKEGALELSGSRSNLFDLLHILSNGGSSRIAPSDEKFIKACKGNDVEVGGSCEVNRSTLIQILSTALELKQREYRYSGQDHDGVEVEVVVRVTKDVYGILEYIGKLAERYYRMVKE